MNVIVSDERPAPTRATLPDPARVLEHERQDAAGKPPSKPQDATTDAEATIVDPSAANVRESPWIDTTHWDW